MPGDSKALKRFVISLSKNYANLCDQVFAPSESIAELIRKRGVKTPIAVIPTGVNLNQFKNANGKQFRRIMGIPDNAFVVGHLGRLAKEKNLEFLVNAVIAFLKKYPEEKNTCFLLVGEGPMKDTIKAMFAKFNLSDRLYTVGILGSSEVANTYNAMDVFAFASKSETQGMVITEAMAGGAPVVAIDAPGVREVVRDGINGRLLTSENIDEFAEALQWIRSKSIVERKLLQAKAEATAIEFSMPHTAEKALKIYNKLNRLSQLDRQDEFDSWTNSLNFIEAEWDRIKDIFDAVGDAVFPQGDEN
jgi:glycosyltransferase involved in cell wall biosynthesis